jgi:caa(3)-type oxidase subunit IV
MTMQEQDELVHDIRPRAGGKFVFALIALVALTALSFGLHFAGLGNIGMVAALVIAGVKVTIVGLIFMELRDSLPATRMLACVGLAFVALLCLGIVGDVAFR